MTPRLHDELKALGSLFFSGDMTDQEWALLQVHMAYCASCRQAFRESQDAARSGGAMQ